jgi:hypothetical protein
MDGSEPNEPSGVTAVHWLPPYPRVAHLVAGWETSEGLIIGPHKVRALPDWPLIRKGKLDGESVPMWIEEEIVQVVLRFGGGPTDRSGHLGLLVWIAQRSDYLRSLLGNRAALYAECPLLTRLMPYDELPGRLVCATQSRIPPSSHRIGHHHFHQSGERVRRCGRRVEGFRHGPR